MCVCVCVCVCVKGKGKFLECNLIFGWRQNPEDEVQFISVTRSTEKKTRNVFWMCTVHMIWEYLCMHACVLTCMCAYACICVCVCVDVHVCGCIHMCIFSTKQEGVRSYVISSFALCFRYRHQSRILRNSSRKPPPASLVHHAVPSILLLILTRLQTWPPPTNLPGQRELLVRGSQHGSQHRWCGSPPVPSWGHRVLCAQGAHGAEEGVAAVHPAGGRVLRHRARDAGFPLLPLRQSAGLLVPGFLSHLAAPRSCHGWLGVSPL